MDRRTRIIVAAELAAQGLSICAIARQRETATMNRSRRNLVTRNQWKPVGLVLGEPESDA